MTNIEIVTNSLGDEHVIIENADGSFTSMTKAHYEELEAQREQSGTL